MPMSAVPAKNSASPFASWRGSHVAVRVADYDAAKRWYMEKLDFRVLHEWPFGGMQLAYLLPPNDDVFSVELLGGGSPSPQPSYPDIPSSFEPAGYHHFCLSVDNVDETAAELRHRGVKIVAEPFDLAAISRRLCFVADPWGNLIEFAQTLA